MGITVSTDTGITSAQRTVIAEAQYTQQFRTPMADLVTKYTLAKGDKSIIVPKWGTLAAAALTEGVDLQNPQSATMTTTTITTTEVGLLVVLTDKMIRQMNDDALKSVGKMMGEAMAKKIDSDGCDLFSGLDGTLGAAGTTLTAGYCSAAITKLEGQPAPGPFAMILHPYQMNRIMNSLAPAGTYPIPDGFSATVLKNFYKGQLFAWGLPFFSDGNIATISGDDAYGACLSKLALAYAVEKEYATETERNASLRGFELVCVADYSWTEINGTYGVYMLFDAVAPTS